jgi:hypothetical protein
MQAPAILTRCAFIIRGPRPAAKQPFAQMGGGRTHGDVAWQQVQLDQAA